MSFLNQIKAEKVKVSGHVSTTPIDKTRRILSITADLSTGHRELLGLIIQRGNFNHPEDCELFTNGDGGFTSLGIFEDLPRAIEWITELETRRLNAGDGEASAFDGYPDLSRFED